MKYIKHKVQKSTSKVRKQEKRTAKQLIRIKMKMSKSAQAGSNAESSKRFQKVPQK